MIIYVNGKTLNVLEGLTIEDLVRQNGLDQGTVLIEHNLILVKKEDWAGILLKENDRIEILRFVGGG